MKQGRPLLTPYVLIREYERTHPLEDSETLRLNQVEIVREFFSIPVADLELSLDDFSKKRGWM